MNNELRNVLVVIGAIILFFALMTKAVHMPVNVGGDNVSSTY